MPRLHCSFLQDFGVQPTRAQHQLASTIILLHEASQDVWHGRSKSNKHISRSALSIRRHKEQRQQDLGLIKTKALQNSSWSASLGYLTVRPDISFAVKELSRSLQAPTQQDEKQLKQVLRYLKGTLHFTTSLQPPRKRVIERASSIHIQACFDSALEGSPQTKKSTSGATLSLWGVPLAASSRTQASQASSSAEAELYAMGMATQDALHLKSFLQEMQLSQLAKPFELTVYTDSSSGKALASKLGLSKKKQTCSA